MPSEDSHQTVRDRVWDAVLVVLDEQGSFKISDLGFEEGKRHTVRRVLRAMSEQGWLYREHKRMKTWHPGDKALEYLDIDDEAKLEAELAMKKS